MCLGDLGRRRKVSKRMEQGVTRLNKIFGQVMPRKMGLLVSLFNQITYDRYFKMPWWHQKTTTIQITKTRDRLDAMGKRRESYDGYIE